MWYNERTGKCGTFTHCNALKSAGGWQVSTTLWPRFATDKKCTGKKKHLANVGSQKECQLVAESRSHPYYQYRMGNTVSTSLKPKCSTSKRCDEPKNRRNMHVYTVYLVPKAQVDQDLFENGAQASDDYVQVHRVDGVNVDDVKYPEDTDISEECRVDSSCMGYCQHAKGHVYLLRQGNGILSDTLDWVKSIMLKGSVVPDV